MMAIRVIGVGGSRRDSDGEEGGTRGQHVDGAFQCIRVERYRAGQPVGRELQSQYDNATPTLESATFCVVPQELTEVKPSPALASAQCEAHTYGFIIARHITYA
jgi:hypothetical protein